MRDPGKKGLVFSEENVPTKSCTCEDRLSRLPEFRSTKKPRVIVPPGFVSTVISSSIFDHKHSGLHM